MGRWSNGTCNNRKWEEMNHIAISLFYFRIADVVNLDRFIDKSLSKNNLLRIKFCSKKGEGFVFKNNLFPTEKHVKNLFILQKEKREKIIIKDQLKHFCCKFLTAPDPFFPK